MTDRELEAVFIDVCLSVVGFSAMSMSWRRVTRTKVTPAMVRTLALVWMGIALFGIAMIFVMRHVP